MLVSGGRVIAIDSVNTNSATLSGDGVWKQLGLNTSAVIDPIKSDISAISSTVSAVSGKLDKEIADRQSAISALSAEFSAELDTEIANRTSADSALSGHIDFVSGELDLETDERIAADDLLSAAIDTKQDILSAGENIYISGVEVGVSGKSPLITTGPIFAVETSSGIVVGLDEYTTHEYFDGVIGTDKSTNDFVISGTQFSATPDVKYLTLSLNYNVNLDNPNEDFIYENGLNISSSGMNETYKHYIQGLVSSDCYSLNLNIPNTSPYTITLTGDSISSSEIKLGCIGVKYHYADNYVSEYDENDVDKIIVFNKTYDVLADENGNVLSFGNDEQENVEPLEV